MAGWNFEFEQRLASTLKEIFKEKIINIIYSNKQVIIETREQDAKEIIKFIKDEPDFEFVYLQDICGVDNLNQQKPERFCVVYNLYSFKNNAHIRIKSYIPEDKPQTDTIVDIFPGANWPEREVFDMFGIKFMGHPDLKRILLPETFKHHPLRKDYPLEGLGERFNFPRYEKDTV